MKKTALPLVLLVLLPWLPLGCNKEGNAPPTVPEIRIFTHLSADYTGGLAHEWMELGVQMVRENQLTGPVSARIYGYLGLAAWESVCRGIPDANSLAGQLRDYPEAAATDISKAYDWGIVLATAMRTLFPELVDDISPAQRGQVNALANLQEDLSLQTGLPETVHLDSRSLGERIGARLVERARNDGRAAIRNLLPILPQRDAAHPWYWEAETPGQRPTEPVWSAVHTFVLDNAQACVAAGPLPYSELPGSAFYQQAEEVRTIQRTPANLAIAYHWEDGPGRSSSPAGHWVSITEQLLQQQERNLAESAKAYCLVGLAAADTYSCCWHSKYQYFLLRPATYIHAVIDPSWKPALFTPPHPDHVSASAAMGAAAPTVLTGLLGDGPFIDRTHLNSPLLTPAGGPFILSERAFTSLTQAGEEQAESRVVAGVNFRQASEQGLAAGRCVGNAILTRLDFGF